MRYELEAAINAAAAAHDGVLTRAELIALGLSAAAIARRLRRGRIRRLQRGVYLLGPLMSDSAVELAAVLAGGPGAVLSHPSAAVAWKMGRTDTEGPVHVSIPRNRDRHGPGIRFHRVRPLTDDERAIVRGIPVTAPGRTLADLSGMLGSREVEQAAAVALREGLLSRAELAALPRRYAGRRGISILRAVCRQDAGPAFTRSEAERRCLNLLRTAALPRPHANVAVGPYELDLLWPEEGLALEIDGHAYHSSREQFEGDRRKDIWLRARGVEVIRLSWRQLTRDTMATAVQIGQALALARARREAWHRAPPHRGERTRQRSRQQGTA